MGGEVITDLKVILEIVGKHVLCRIAGANVFTPRGSTLKVEETCTIYSAVFPVHHLLLHDKFCHSVVNVVSGFEKKNCGPNFFLYFQELFGFYI